MKFNLSLEIGNICNIYCTVFTKSFVKLFLWNHFQIFFLIRNRKVVAEQFECSPEFPNFSKPHGYDASLIQFESTKKVISFCRRTRCDRIWFLPPVRQSACNSTDTWILTMCQKHNNKRWLPVILASLKYLFPSLFLPL